LRQQTQQLTRQKIFSILKYFNAFAIMMIEKVQQHHASCYISCMLSSAQSIIIRK
jgi:hypothetical protein